MGIYYWNLISISIIGFFVSKRAKKLKLEKICYILVWLQMCIISALRYNVGTDYATYRYIFLWIRSTGSLKLAIEQSPVEVGYTILNYAFGLFTDNFIFVSAFFSFVTITLFLISIRRYSYNPWFSVFLFVTLGYLYSSYNAIRQMLACSIILFGWRFLLEKRYFLFVVLVLFAALFHTSVLIVIPLLLLVNIRLTLKFLFSFSSLIILCTFILPSMINYFVLVFPKYQIYLGTPEFMPGWNLRRMTFWLIIFGIVYIFYLYFENKSTYLKQLVNFLYFAVLFSVLQGGIAIVTRMIPYFSIFSIFALPVLLKNFSDIRQKRFVGVGMAFFAILFHAYLLYAEYYGVVPYKAITF